MNPLSLPNEYSPKELRDGAGIDLLLYNQWLYRNIFTATYPAEGPGTPSRYIFADILTVALIVRLRKADIRLKRASNICHEIIEELVEWQKKNKADILPPVYIIFKQDGKVKIDIAETGAWEMLIRLDIDAIASNAAGRIEGSTA